MTPLELSLINWMKRTGPMDSVMDLPCGNAEILGQIAREYPKSKLLGVDLHFYKNHDEIPKEVTFQYKDLSKELPIFGQFSVVVSKFGISEFENTETFFKGIYNNLKPSGRFFLVYDSIQSIRDRLSFLLFGKFTRFSLFLDSGFVTYKSITIQEIHKLLIDRRFIVREIRFLVPFREGYLWLPIALPFWLIGYIYSLWEKSTLPMAKRRQLFPLKSYLARHYIVLAEKPIE